MSGFFCIAVGILRSSLLLVHLFLHALLHIIELALDLPARSENRN